MAYTDTNALSAIVADAYSKVAIIKATGNAEYWGKWYIKNYDLAGNGNGSTIKVPVYGAMASASGELSETTDPTMVALSATSADITLKEYGNLVGITEKVELSTPSDVLFDASESLGLNMGLSLDNVAAAIFTAGTNEIDHSTAVFSADYLIDSIKTLKDNDAPTFEDGFYVSIISPKQAADLKKDADFLAGVSYMGYDKILRGYVGDYQGTHVIESSHVPVDTNVYKAISFGLNALGQGKAYDPKIVVTPPVDGLQRVTSAGWKALIGWAILVDSYVVRVLSL